MHEPFGFGPSGTFDVEASADPPKNPAEGLHGFSPSQEPAQRPVYCCRACGATNSPSLKYCSMCGTPTVHPPRPASQRLDDANGRTTVSHAAGRRRINDDHRDFSAGGGSSSAPTTSSGAGGGGTGGVSSAGGEAGAVCKFYKSNRCRNASGCRFLHVGPVDAEKPPNSKGSRSHSSRRSAEATAKSSGNNARQAGHKNRGIDSANEVDSFDATRERANGRTVLEQREERVPNKEVEKWAHRGNLLALEDGHSIHMFAANLEPSPLYARAEQQKHQQQEPELLLQRQMLQQDEQQLQEQKQQDQTQQLFLQQHQEQNIYFRQQPSQQQQQQQHQQQQQLYQLNNVDFYRQQHQVHQAQDLEIQHTLSKINISNSSSSSSAGGPRRSGIAAGEQTGGRAADAGTNSSRRRGNGRRSSAVSGGNAFGGIGDRDVWHETSPPAESRIELPTSPAAEGHLQDYTLPEFDATSSSPLSSLRSFDAIAYGGRDVGYSRGGRGWSSTSTIDPSLFQSQTPPSVAGPQQFQPSASAAELRDWQAQQAANQAMCVAVALALPPTVASSRVVAAALSNAAPSSGENPDNTNIADGDRGAVGDPTFALARRARAALVADQAAASEFRGPAGVGGSFARQQGSATAAGASSNPSEGPPSRNLYVHGFPDAMNETHIEALFAMFCEVQCVVMKQVLNRHTGSEEGRYCFVWTADAAAASTARYALDKFSLLNGFLLQVNFAREPPHQSSSGGDSTAQTPRARLNASTDLREAAKTNSFVNPLVTAVSAGSSAACSGAAAAGVRGVGMSDAAEMNGTSSLLSQSPLPPPQPHPLAPSAAARAAGAQASGLVPEAMVALLSAADASSAAAAVAEGAHTHKITRGAAADFAHSRMSAASRTATSTAVGGSGSSSSSSGGGNVAHRRAAPGGGGGSSGMQSNPPSRNLFVANFPTTATASEVEALFARHCTVKRVVMKPAGYCFVWTGAIDQAVRARDALHNKPFMGMALQVAYAKERSAENHQSNIAHSGTLPSTTFAPGHQVHITPMPPQPTQSMSARPTQPFPPRAEGTGNVVSFNGNQIGNHLGTAALLPPRDYFDGNLAANTSAFGFTSGHVLSPPLPQSRGFDLHSQQQQHNTARGAPVPPPGHMPHQLPPPFLPSPPPRGNHNFNRGFSSQQAYAVGPSSSGNFSSGGLGLGEPVLGGNVSLDTYYGGLPMNGDTKPPFLPHHYSSGQPQVMREQQQQDEVGHFGGGYGAIPRYPFGHPVNGSGAPAATFAEHLPSSGSATLNNSALHGSTVMNSSALDGREAIHGSGDLYSEVRGDSKSNAATALSHGVDNSMGLDLGGLADHINDHADLASGNFDSVFGGFGVGNSFGAYGGGRSF